ncbi:MAG TPA: hypothetical protein VEZ89_17960 [Rubrivivax sp.]|nr:hypothetical protein [Rubrivivax sp.]
MKTTTLASLLLALPVVALAQGQTIWRCGADASSYSSTPCAEGRPIEPLASPSSLEQAEARRIALAEERLADRMRSDRLREEAASRRAPTAGFQANKASLAVNARSTKAAAQRQPEADRTWRGVGPSSRRAKG